VSDRMVTWYLVARRTTSAFFLLRGAVFVAGLAALVTACPSPLVLSPWLAGLVLVALLAAAFPRSWLVMLLLLTGAISWVVATTAYAEPVSYLRLVLLAALLYLTHVLAALAAVIPNDAVVTPAAVVGWLPRTAVLLAVTALVALLAAVLPGLFGGARFVLAALVGFGVMAVLVYYLARLANRG
jgi:hypothetical protein